MKHWIVPVIAVILIAGGIYGLSKGSSATPRRRTRPISPASSCRSRTRKPSAFRNGSRVARSRSARCSCCSDARSPDARDARALRALRPRAAGGFRGRGDLLFRVHHARNPRAHSSRVRARTRRRPGAASDAGFQGGDLTYASPVREENPGAVMNESTGKLILRITLGFLILLHGIAKLMQRYRLARRRPDRGRPADLLQVRRLCRRSRRAAARHRRLLLAHRRLADRGQHAVRARPGALGRAVRHRCESGGLGARKAIHVPLRRHRPRPDRAGTLRGQPEVRCVTGNDMARVASTGFARRSSARTTGSSRLPAS